MRRSYFWKAVLIVACCAAVLLALVYADRSGLWRQLAPYYALVTDRERIKAFISSFGLGAPAVFMLIQILQVMFAPIPGEATGFIGGYLFGPGRGFLYSSVALAAGSLILRESGGIVSGLDGGENYMETGHVLCGTPKIYSAVARLFASDIKAMFAESKG